MAERDTLLRRRMAQIDRAYKARDLPTLTRAQRAALDKERARQIALAVREYEDSKPIQKGIKKVSKPIDIPTKAPKKKAAKKAAKKAPRKRAPSKKAVSHAKKASRFWKHFARDGSPVSPWELSVGPGMDIDDDDASAMDEPLFAEGDYDYDDFDADWGGYEYEDTGYPDEDA